MKPYIAQPRQQSPELRRGIKILRQANLRVTGVDTLRKMLAPLLHRYVHPSPLILPGELIFRAVSWNERPSHISHLKYPPPHKVACYGRCNRPGEPVFYGSTSGISAIQEISPPNGSRLALSMWQVTKPILAASVGYTERTFRDLGSTRSPDVWWQRPVASELAPIGAYTPENKFVDRFLAREFTRSVSKEENWKYKLSATISETYLQGQAADDAVGEIPGLLRSGESTVGTTLMALIYPSIASAANNDNIVINREASDSSLSLVWVQFLEIARHPERSDQFDPKGLDFADRIAPNGELLWFDKFPGSLVPGTDLYLDMVGGELVLIDSRNRVAGKFSASTAI